MKVVLATVLPYALLSKTVLFQPACGVTAFVVTGSETPNALENLVTAVSVFPAAITSPVSNKVLEALFHTRFPFATELRTTEVIGIMATEKGNAGFLANTDIAGVFSKLLQIGQVATTAESVVRHSDGTFTVAGSSSETLAGKKVAGISA